ncbi:MAG: DMT family transporter [Gemmatimonadales bacterium]|nr:MAG: DMT family transporter [Gemmatimonadales bacterium]
MSGPTRSPAARDPAPVPPVLVLGLAVVAFSWAAPLVRFTTAPASAIALWRLVLATAVLVLLLSVRSGGWRPLLRLPRRDLALGLLAGVLLALHFWSWIASIQYTSVASSVLLVSTQPLFVALLSGLLLGERPAPREWAGILVAAAGAGWIGWSDATGVGGMALRGDLLAVLGALLAALYFIVGRSVRRRLDLVSWVTLVYGAAALVLVVVVSLQPDVSLVRGYSRTDWLVFVGLAAGPMLVGHTGVNYALRYVRAYLANLAVLGEPVGATLIAWVLPAIAERPSGATLGGGALILAGVALATLRGPSGRAR